MRRIQSGLRVYVCWLHTCVAYERVHTVHRKGIFECFFASFSSLLLILLQWFFCRIIRIRISIAISCSMAGFIIIMKLTKIHHVLTYVWKGSISRMGFPSNLLKIHQNLSNLLSEYFSKLLNLLRDWQCVTYANKRKIFFFFLRLKNFRCNLLNFCLNNRKTFDASSEFYGLQFSKIGFLLSHTIHG